MKNNIKILYFCLEEEESGLGKQIPVPKKKIIHKWEVRTDQQFLSV